jgi:hypothetical protein
MSGDDDLSGCNELPLRAVDCTLGAAEEFSAVA